MPCYHPVTAWQRIAGGQAVFHPIPDSRSLQLPCRQCIGCRLSYSAQWAVRMMHELRDHDRSSFLTLTYSPEHIPPDGSLVLGDHQLFMKRLRERVCAPIRFYHCGEYGEKFGRPHYHYILYGFSFTRDAYEFSKSDRGDETWSSRLLDDLWGKGRARVGSVTFESAAYCARYITKKVNGEKAVSHYERVNFGERSDLAIGECWRVRPEYATMSKRPGLGFNHWLKYRDEIVANDSVVARGREFKPPRTYDRWLADIDNLKYEELKQSRECASRDRGGRGERQLAIDEVNKQAQLRSLSRSYEIG